MEENAMTTYRELLARRNEFSIYSPEWLSLIHI